MILKDIYESRELKIEEVVDTDGKKRNGVLGVVEGVFFVPEKPSRNGRVYPKGLWENVLRRDDVRRLLNDRLMIGTVGHEDVDFDALIREQKVSHVVTDLWLGEDGRGYGRAEILDTPVGRVLYTLLKNGSKMAVSSKAWGEYKGTDSRGYYIVDESNFILERFDFVVDPGFLDAMPSLRKQYENILGGNKKMEVVEVLTKEKLALQEKVSELLGKVKELEEKNKELEEKNSRMEEKIKESRESGEKVLASIKEAFEKNLGIADIEEALKEIGLLSKLIEEEGEELVAKGVSEEELSGESLSEVFIRLVEQLKKQAEREGVSERKIKELLKGRLKERKRVIEARRKIARLEELLTEARRKLVKIESMGGVDKVYKVLRLSEKFMEKLLLERKKEVVEKLSAKYGVNRDKVEKMIERMGKKRTEEILSETGKKSIMRESYGKWERIDSGSDVFDKTMVERVSERLIKM